MRSRRVAFATLLSLFVVGCAPALPATAPATALPTGAPAAATSGASTEAPSFASEAPSGRVEHSGLDVVQTGEPIDISSLSGRIVFDDFENVFSMNVDGSDLVEVANDPTGSEFDGAWSPDGEWIVYRDSTRGINVDDEIYVARADGSGRRNISKHPANDWGPDWSPDGTTIAFNSDREGEIRGFLMSPDGSNVRRIEIDQWLEYPSFSPDGTRIVFEGPPNNSYEIFVADLASGHVDQLTRAPGNDSWAVWSPDGQTIAFTSQRDDCSIAPREQECWRDESPDDEHNDIWTMAPDGSNLRRVTPESGQFVAWSPDSRYLLISGRALYVVRPDGTGRVELRTPSIPRALGGIPDWRAHSEVTPPAAARARLLSRRSGSDARPGSAASRREP